MNKRLVATVLWFNVGWVAGSMASFFLGLPSGLDITLSLAFATVIWWDPAHLLWLDRARPVDRKPPFAHGPQVAAE
jgi:hypothetical protein